MRAASRPLEAGPAVREGAGWVLAATVVIGLLVAAHLVWIQRDRALPLWDESQYLLESVRIHQALVEHGPMALLDTFSRSMGNKAPLIAALPLPLPTGPVASRQKHPALNAHNLNHPTSALSEDYHVFVHLYDTADGRVTHADYSPGHKGRPTSGWRPGEVVEASVPLPRLEGRHRLFVGWYRPGSSWQLPLTGAEASWGGEPNGLELRLQR